MCVKVKVQKPQDEAQKKTIVQEWSVISTTIWLLLDQLKEEFFIKLATIWIRHVLIKLATTSLFVLHTIVGNTYYNPTLEEVS